MKNSRIILFSVLLSLLVSPTPGFTYSKDTHERLNEEALKGSIVDSYLKNNLSFSDGIDEIINKKRVWKWIIDGGRTEDKPIRFRNHFHNPLEEDWKKAGYGIFKSSILWAQDINQGWSWKNARDYYHLALTSATKEERDQNFANLFRALGQVMHLIEDSAVPAHSRNDAHVLYNYEDWVKGADLDSFLANPKGFDKDILNITPNPLAPIPIARIVDTDIYDGTDPEVIIGNFIGLSEYTNRHFLSADTIFTNDFPYPTLAETDYREFMDMMAEDGEIDRVFYIGTVEVDHLAGVTLSRRMVKKLKEDGAADIDPDFWLKKGFTNKYDECLKNYAKLLVPRAVGYSTGLLNYFFRGKLSFELKCIEEPYLKFVVTNRSSERITGTLSLYWDDKNGNRSKVDGAEWSVNLAPGGATYPNYALPANAMRCIWVFRGTLGNELNTAVIGKVVELAPMTYSIWNNNDFKFGFGTPPPPSLGSYAHFGTLSLTLTGCTISEWDYCDIGPEQCKTYRYTYDLCLTPENPALPSVTKPYVIYVYEERCCPSPRGECCDDAWVCWSDDPTTKEPFNTTIVADGVQSVREICQDVSSSHAEGHYRRPSCAYINNCLINIYSDMVPSEGTEIYFWGTQGVRSHGGDDNGVGIPGCATFWGAGVLYDCWS